MKRILAVDYGQRRIGLAVSDPMGLLAHPVKTVVVKSRKQAVREIVETAEKLQVEEIVVGMPVSLDGSHGPQWQETRQFVADLAKELAIPIRGWDERLTTEAAHRELRELGKKPSRERDIVDQLAAVHILQSYLDWLKREQA
ncbi:MAG: Holliday junction resolvase RuvX [Calditrichaeota bacterium]|nr:Holliday junction resolvase RuvX [Calditrichota bacterium]